MARYFSPAFLSAQVKAQRLMLSGLMALQAAIAGTVVSEFVLTVPQPSVARMALAQGHSLASAENAVVYIETDRGSGSGVIIEADGLILTNAHVVEGARQVKVTIQGRSVPAEVVATGHADCLDLALLKVSSQTNLPVIQFGDITQVYKTQPVFAIGYPGVLPSDSATITNGIVSNLHQQMGLVQFDGSINGGNSGGAVVNSEAKLIGIATKKIADDNTDGLSFAVSIDKVIAFVDAYHRGAPAVVGRAIMPGRNPDSGRLVQSLALDGQTVSGVLQAGDSAYCGDGSLADVYTVEAEAGQAIMLDMISQDMGVYLMLFGPNGELLAQTGSQSQNQAAIILEKLPQTGTYSVIANATQADRTGRYQLRATEPMLMEQGRLTSRTRPCFAGGQRCQDYPFQGEENQTVTVVLQQAEFTPYLVLLDAEGQIIAEGQTDPEAVVNFTLPASGWYTLIVSSVEPEAQGQFVVSVHDTETLTPAEAVSQR